MKMEDVPSVRSLLTEPALRAAAVSATRDKTLTPAMQEGSVSKTVDERVAVKLVAQDSYTVYGYAFLPAVLLSADSPMEQEKRLMAMQAVIVLFPSGMETQNRKDALLNRNLPTAFANASPPQVRKPKAASQDEPESDPYGDA